MRVLYAFGSAFFAGVTAVLAKIGLEHVNSNLATALRTGVVTVMAWLIVFVTGSQTGLSDISGKSWLFLVLSGLATGASWICCFRALQLGNVNQVAPIDKSSTVLTMLLAFVLLGEPLTPGMLLGMVLLLTGTYWMLPARTKETPPGGRSWLGWAVLSAVFASLTSILGKVGITGINSHLGTAIRTVVVLMLAWLIVFSQGRQREIPAIRRKSWVFLVLSGLATGASWLCYYRALQEGPASIVVPIDKLSILVTAAFSAWVLKEPMNTRAKWGLFLLTAGTLLLLAPF